MMDAVWPETAVSDVVVRMAIGEVRRALGDTTQASRYIATVHRRSYHFVVPVVEHTEGVPGPTSPVSPAASQVPLAVPSPLLSPVAPLPEPTDAPRHQGVAPFPSALSPPEAERRHLTVPFCDLVGLTALAGRLDPEDLREIVRVYYQTCAEVIERFDGYLAQYLGDGVLVYFGYPVAHEDDAQRAVRAGLALLDAFAPLTTRLALPTGDLVAARLGVHTGLMVVGDVGVGTRHEPLVLGETPNIAARLQQMARLDTVLVSEATHRVVVGFFETLDLGEMLVPGHAPIRAFEVLRPRSRHMRFDVAVERGLTLLIGRARARTAP